LCSHKYYPSDNSRKRAPGATVSGTRNNPRPAYPTSLVYPANLDVRFTTTRQKFFHWLIAHRNKGVSRSSSCISWHEENEIPAAALTAKKITRARYIVRCGQNPATNIHRNEQDRRTRFVPMRTCTELRFHEAKLVSRGTGCNVSG